VPRERYDVAMDPLATALAALRDDRCHDALVALVEAWRAAPCPELAAVVLRVSARLPVNATPLRGRSADAHRAWISRARRPALDDIPILLDTLATVRSEEATNRMEIVVKWPADPRIDAALLALLERLPFQAQTTRPFWRHVFARLRKTRDRGVIAELEQRLDAIPNNTPPTTAQWFCGQLRDVLDDLRALPVVKPPELAAIEHALAALDGARRDVAADVLAAVYAQPDDDAPRLVYADALQERGDPRGELIALQIRLAIEAGEPAMRVRERELLREHGDAWLGALAPIVLPPFAFERGFLAMVTIDGRKHELVERLAQDPCWATIRRVAIKLTAPVNVARTIAILRLLPTTVRQIEVTAHAVAPDGIAQIREAAAALRHLEYCNVSS
jgi:uncharacterized protein (TIGR02996 family)